MAFCKACGQDIGDASFCPKCGAAQGAAGGATPSVAVPSPSSSAAGYPTAGIDENVAGLLCYIFWWVSGLIFLLVDKRPFVRFHAAQDIAFNLVMYVIGFAFWIVALVITAITTAIFHFPLGIFTFFLGPILCIAFLGTWIFLMYKAYNHEMFKLPIIGDMVEKMVNK
jgi:uncharacterized membrane protein